MELIKNRISTSITKAFKMVQITLEDDLNVPDTRPDLDKIIQSQGEIVVQEVESMVDKIRIEGELNFSILYATPQEGLGSFNYNFPFEETIYMDGILPTDSVKVSGMLDDLNVSMINSRKLEIRSLIGLMIRVMDTDIIEGVVEVEGDSSIQVNHKESQITGLVVDKKDMVRLKEEVSIPSNKPNVYQVLWDNVCIQNQEVKLLDEKIKIKGELLLFVLYQGEEEHIPFQNLEWEIPFETEVECAGCKEDMVGNIKVEIGSKQIEVKPDADGEQRVLALDCSLDMEIKIYQEEEINFLRDIYSPNKEFELEKSPFEYECLLVKNNAKTKVNERVELKENQAQLLQICHVEGEPKIDEMECTEAGVQVEGVVSVNIIYISSDDRYPISCLTAMLPFSYLIEAKGVTPEDHFEVDACVEQMNAIMIDGGEIEIKAALQLNMIAFAKKQGTTIVGIEEKPFDEDAFSKMPGVVGYIVQEDDSLWNIAKKFYTTVDDICNMNDISQEIQPGDKLVIVKAVREPLEA